MEIFYIVNRQEKLLEIEIKKNIDLLNKRYSKNEKTLLHIATEHENYSAIRLLMKYGLDVNITDKSLRSPLICACNTGNVKLVQFLLRNGADMNQKSVKGFLPLHQAAWNGHKTIVEQLLLFGAEINSQCTISGDTALHIAVLIGHEDLCKLLIHNGACKNVINLNDKTPYISGVENGKISIRRLQKIFSETNKYQSKKTLSSLEKTPKRSVESVDDDYFSSISEDEPLL